MPLNLEDTIVAIASPAGPAVRGIIRISGPGTISLVARLLDGPVPSAGPPIRLDHRISSKALGTTLPSSTLVWPGTRSYTGQPTAELHVVGSPPVLELLLNAVVHRGARLAERGEFTMRAFLNGRIDLLQAEAVLGVIDAADHQELETALTQLGGGLTNRLHHVRNTIIAILGDLEAGLDFVEEDIEFISAVEITRRLIDARHILDKLQEDSLDRLPSGHRPRVVLAGLPNAGKSTLFNRLTGDERAIASGMPGTTRDYLTCPMTCFGQDIELVDTAGWDDADHSVMSVAHRLRFQQLDQADLVIWCTATDLSRPEAAQDGQLFAAAEQQLPCVLRVTTCTDRPGASDSLSGLQVSAVTGDGISGLQHAISDALSTRRSSKSELLATTTARCRDSIQRAGECIDLAHSSASQQAGDEITAINLREALHELRSILGETWTDDILDHIFSSFCIGK